MGTARFWGPPRAGVPRLRVRLSACALGFARLPVSGAAVHAPAQITNLFEDRFSFLLGITVSYGYSASHFLTNRKLFSTAAAPFRVPAAEGGASDSAAASLAPALLHSSDQRRPEGCEVGSHCVDLRFPKGRWC